jgi:hypothetical protein
MFNNYEAAEIVEIGKAEDIIRGSIKGIFFDDCPNQDLRTIVIEDLE